MTTSFKNNPHFYSHVSENRVKKVFDVFLSFGFAQAKLLAKVY